KTSRSATVWANGFANETPRDGGDEARHRRRSARPFAWSARRARTSETGETCVVWLITQRSRVQIPPPLPRPEALSRTEKGPSACGLCTDLCTAARSSRALTRSDLHRGERTADDQLRQGGSDLPVGFQVGLDILLHGERDIRVSDP